jgi:AraC-like DNA-binding protein
MHYGQAPCALPLFRVPPPYAQLYSLSERASETVRDLPSGTVLVLSAVDSSSNWRCMSRQVPEVRRSFPRAPIVLLLPRSSNAYFTHLAGRAASLHVRAVLVQGEPLAETLRRELTDIPDLAAEVEEWLQFLGLPMSPATRQCIGQAFGMVPACTRAEGFARHLSMPLRTLRGWFEADGLPAPSHWLAAARALRACLFLQRHRERPLLEIALQNSYCDVSALSHQVTRLFGARLSEIRHMLGWEWMLAAWLGRERETTRLLRPLSWTG